MSSFVPKPRVYLAGAITSPTVDLYTKRVATHAKCALALEAQGEVTVYSPASETHGLVELGGKMGTTWTDWRDHDLNMLYGSNRIYVMMMDGWKESKGVRGEVKFAIQHNIPISLIAEDASYIIQMPIPELLKMFGVNETEELND